MSNQYRPYVVSNLQMLAKTSKVVSPDNANAMFRTLVSKDYDIPTKRLPSILSIDSDLDKLADFLLKHCYSDDSGK